VSIEDRYLTLEKESTFEVKIERSHFIGLAIPINGQDISEILKETKSKFKNATHYCYAYRKITGEEYFSDGGEPTGTAGIPILNVLREKDLHDIIGIVIRYFGGVKLGIRGLIDAYHYTMKKAIENSNIIEKVISEKYLLKTSYKDFNILKNEILKNFPCEIRENFLENVILEVSIPLRYKISFEDFINKRGIEIERNSQ